MEVEIDTHIIDWSKPPGRATIASSDEAQFDTRVEHSLHHGIDGIDGPVQLHMFESHPDAPTGRFIWGGCKSVPLSVFRKTD